MFHSSICPELLYRVNRLGFTKYFRSDYNSVVLPQHRDASVTLSCVAVGVKLSGSPAVCCHPCVCPFLLVCLFAGRCVAVGVPAKVIGQGRKSNPALAMGQDFFKEVWKGLDI